MKRFKRIIGVVFMATSLLFLAACDANKSQGRIVPSEQPQAPASPAELKPVVSNMKPAFAVFTLSTGMVHVLAKPKSGPADLIYQNSCSAGSQPFGIADVNFGGKLFCNDASNRRTTIMDMSSQAELFSWNWPVDIERTPTWFIGRWQANKDVGLAAYDSAKGVFHIFNSEAKNFSLSHSFEYGGAGSSTLPLVGDWDGDGNDAVGVYRSSTKQLFLRNTLDSGMADISFGLDGNSYEIDATPVAINLDARTVVAMYSTSTGVASFTSTDVTNSPFLFGAPKESKLAIPIR